MTCVWTALLAGLPADLFPGARKPPPEMFVSMLQAANRPTVRVCVNGRHLSDRNIDENMEWVRNLDPRGVHGGYQCSTADPFLLLVCELFHVNIEHSFTGLSHGQWVQSTIRYTHDAPHRLLRVISNQGHMSFAGAMPLDNPPPTPLG
jgi:hypothetical protein